MVVTLVGVSMKRLHPNARMPVLSTPGSACYDVFALESTPIPPRTVVKIRTGWAFEVSNEYFLDVRPRSGLAVKEGITIVNAPGTLDSDYRGELLVFLYNRRSTIFTVGAGDRVAQIRLAPVIRMALVEVSDLSDTERGGNGFGSTGR